MTAKSKNHLLLFLQGSFISLLGTLAIGIVNLLVRRNLTLNLSEAEYGFLYSAFAPITVCLAFLDLGLGQSGTILMSRRLAADDLPGTDRVYSLIFYFKLASGLILLLLFIALAPFLVTYFFKYPAGLTAFILVSLLLVFQSLETCPAAAFDALKAFGLKNLIQVLKICFIFMAAYLLLPKGGLNGAAAIFSAASLVFLLLSVAMLYYVKKIRILPLKQLDRNDARSAWDLCRWVVLGTAGMTLIANMDTQVLTWISGVEAVGQYQVAVPIAQILQLLAILPVVFTPIVAELWHKKAEKDIGSVCSLMTGFMSIILWVVLIGTFILGQNAVSIIFSRSVPGVTTALIILCAGVPFMASANFFLSTLNAGNAAGKAAVIIFAGVIMNLILNVVLIYFLGINGAALATTISYVAICLLSFAALKKALPCFHLPMKELAWVSTAGIICLIPALLLKMHGGGLFLNIGGTAILLAVYGIIILPVLRRLFQQIRTTMA